MWYTAAKVEFGDTKVGTIFATCKTVDNAVLVDRVKFTSDANGKMIAVPQGKLIRFTQSAARHRFITPSKDFDAIVEESIMLCEGAYC